MASTISSNSFLAGLQALGFTVKETFEFREDQQAGFFAAVAQVITEHVSNDYGDVTPYLQTLWTKKLQNLSQCASYNVDPGVALAQDVYQEFQSKPWSYLLETMRIPEKSAGEIWCTVASAFSLHITWYERIGDDVLTHTFASRDSQSVWVFVSIAEDAPFLHLLRHRDFDGPVREGFPFYAKSEEMVNTAPVFDKRLLAAIGESETKLTEFCSLQSQLINALLQVLSKYPQLPAGNSQQSVRSLFANCEELGSGIDGTLVEQFASVPVPQGQRKPHSLGMCAQFPGELIQHKLPNGTHEMHPECLVAALARQPGNYSCPVCSKVLPKTLVESIIPPENRCSMCARTQNQFLLFRLAHGCLICQVCSMQVASAPSCPKCKQPLTPNDMSELQKFMTQAIRPVYR